MPVLAYHVRACAKSPEAKALRKRAETLLASVNEEDAAELSGLLEQCRQAIAAQDWETVAQRNESLSDMLFYLED